MPQHGASSIAKAGHRAAGRPRPGRRLREHRVGRSIVTRIGVGDRSRRPGRPRGHRRRATPAPTTATPVGADLPLTAASFRTVVATDRDLDEPVTIEFSAPMDPRSVAAALKVQPSVAVVLSWDAAGRVLTVTPQHRWAAGHLPHDHRRRRRARRVRRADGQPGPCGVPDPGRGRRPDRRDRAGRQARRRGDGLP